MKLFVISQATAMMMLHMDDLFAGGPNILEIRNEWPDVPDLRCDQLIPKKWKERDVNKTNRTNRSPGSTLGKKKWWE